MSYNSELTPEELADQKEFEREMEAEEAAEETSWKKYWQEEAEREIRGVDIEDDLTRIALINAELISYSLQTAKVVEDFKDQIIKNARLPHFGLKELHVDLFDMASRFDWQTVATMINLLAETDMLCMLRTYHSNESRYRLARLICAGDIEVLRQALHLLRKIRHFDLYHLQLVASAIKKYSAGAILQTAMLVKKVTMAENEALDFLYGSSIHWRNDRVNHNMQDMVLAACVLGPEKVKKMFFNFEARGADNLTCVYFIHKIAMTLQFISHDRTEGKIVRYSNDHIVDWEKSSKESAILVNQVLNLFVEVAMPADVLARNAFDLIDKHEATISECRDILLLMKEHGITRIMNIDFGLAAKWYRDPRNREVVVQAFVDNDTHRLNYMDFVDHGMIGLGALFCGDPVGFLREISRGLAKEYAVSAHLRTQEIMLPRYAKLGIFGYETDLIPEQAKNPLISGMAQLRHRRVPWTSARIFAHANQVFGHGIVHEVTTWSPDGYEHEYVSALLRLGNPNNLRQLLTSLPQNGRLDAIMHLNRNSLNQFFTALNIVLECELPPDIYLRSAIHSLTWPHKDVVYVWARNDLLITSENECNYQAFLQLDEFTQSRFLRAVRMYNRVFANINHRLQTGYVW